MFKQALFSTIILSSLALCACEAQPDAVGSAEAEITQSDREPAFLEISKAKLGTAFPLVMTDVESGDAVTFTCKVKPAEASLKCIGLGATALDLVATSAGSLTYRFDMFDLGYEPDDVVMDGIRVIHSWFWGTYCELDEADQSACNEFCDGEVDRLFVAYDQGFCRAVCKCEGGAINVVGEAPLSVVSE